MTTTVHRRARAVSENDAVGRLGLMRGPDEAIVAGTLRTKVDGFEWIAEADFDREPRKFAVTYPRTSRR